MGGCLSRAHRFRLSRIPSLEEPVQHPFSSAYPIFLRGIRFSAAAERRALHTRPVGKQIKVQESQTSEKQVAVRRKEGGWLLRGMFGGGSSMRCRADMVTSSGCRVRARQTVRRGSGRHRAMGAPLRAQDRDSCGSVFVVIGGTAAEVPSSSLVSPDRALAIGVTVLDPSWHEVPCR